ncbi:MAG TPA: AAA family ATPase [Clostridia bacterium]|nr:AAA family ATPase [Clostridia bacterium]
MVGIHVCRYPMVAKSDIQQIMLACSRVSMLYVVPLFDPASAMPQSEVLRTLTMELVGVSHIKLRETNQKYSLSLDDICDVLSEPNLLVFLSDSCFEYIHMFEKLTVSLFPSNNINCLNLPMSNWDDIPLISRWYFAKKVLFAGVESTGKSTYANIFSKIYNSSCTFEYGRYYSRDFLGGDDRLFSEEDFTRIAIRQRELEQTCISQANRIAFFDTDLIMTQFYCLEFLGKKCHTIDALIQSDCYDLIFILEPDVIWVQDDVRYMKTSDIRSNGSKRLKKLFCSYGYEKKIVSLCGDFQNKFLICKGFIEELLHD